MKQETLDALTKEMQSWADREYGTVEAYYADREHRVDFLIGEEKNYRGKVVGINAVLESIARKENLEYKPIISRGNL